MILIRRILGIWNPQNKINSFFTRLKFPPFVMFFSQDYLFGTRLDAESLEEDDRG